MEEAYYDVLAASCALGPADDVFKAGKREPCRTAILYNRSHEIWNGGAGRMNRDWMWTYIALRNWQIPVDVVIEEDLTPETLKKYSVLFLGGFHLHRRHLAAVREWVQGGGLLIGTPGAATRDTEDNPMAETEAIFGAKQTVVMPQPVKRGDGPVAGPEVRFGKSALFPEAKFTTCNGVRSRAVPSTGEIAGNFADGSPAAVINAVGKGKAVLLCFQPGHTYAEAEGSLGTKFVTDEKTGKKKGVWYDRPTTAVREWLTAPVLRHLGRQKVEYSEPRTESTVFEGDRGLAVLLTSYAFEPPAKGHLSVATDRDVKSAASALRGPLKFEEKDGRVEVDVPKLDPVDVIILR